MSNIGNTIYVDDLFLPFLHREDIFTPLSLLPSGNRFYHVLASFFFLTVRRGMHVEGGKAGPEGWCGSGTGEGPGRARAAGQAAWRVAGGLLVVGSDPA